MAYDRHLADKITQILSEKKVPFYEKEMMGGITWMVDEKMCISIFTEVIMARIDPEEMEELLTKQGTEQMVRGGKSMKGYINVLPEGYDSDEHLEFWVDKCVEYNPKARASKKKR